MNTYIYAGNSALLVVKDNDLNSVSSVRNHYLNIDWAWVIEEDGVLKFNGKELCKGWGYCSCSVCFL